MEFREEITPEMQEAWFRKINNDINYYFLIIAEDKEIGLINVRDINYKIGQGESGIFIWDDEYLNTPISFQASFCLTDFCFDELHLISLQSHVLKDNSRAIKFNIAMGYQLSPNQDDKYNQEYTLTQEKYITHRNKILKLLRYGN